MIIFPAIDLRRGRCVRLQQGRAERETVYGRDPAALARRWAAQGARWLHIVNLDGALGEARDNLHTGRTTAGPASIPLNLRRLVEIHQAVPNIPIQFGGGVRSLTDVQALLDLGATRVILGTAAVETPDLVARAIRRFGAERIVVGIDTRDGRVAIRGWQRTSHATACSLALAVQRLGVVRIIYTDIARDGMLIGPNVEATVALARATGLRVIASGGVASLADLARLRLHSAEIEGVVVGQALYRGLFSLSDAIQTLDPGQGAPHPAPLP
jgi:phosphoribosylformimino-5-aminoimidazole carboxamide ribotide isomerase